MSSSSNKNSKQRTEEEIKEELREELEEEAQKGKEGIFGDVIKKIVSVGVGAAFMTEDTVRGFLHDVPIPREMVNGLLQNARKSKEEFLTAVQEEVRRYLSKVDPKNLVDEVADNYDLQVNATISFRRKNQSQNAGAEGPNQEQQDDESESS